MTIKTKTQVRMKYTQSTREYKKVGVATRYGLDGPGLESRGERDFLHLPRQAVGLTKPPIQFVPVLFPRSKVAGPGVNHPPLSSTDVEERVELYL
jgi:hypothetical protein